MQVREAELMITVKVTRRSKKRIKAISGVNKVKTGQTGMTAVVSGDIGEIRGMIESYAKVENVTWMK